MLTSRAALQTVVFSMLRQWYWRDMRRTAVPSLRGYPEIGLGNTVDLLDS